MFNFFQTIFSGVTSLVASAIIAIGIVSMPSPAPIVQPLPQIQNEEVLAVQETGTQKSESHFEEQLGALKKKLPESLNKEVDKAKTENNEGAKQASGTTPTPTPNPTPTSTTVSAPTSAPIPTSTPTSTTTSTPTITPTSTSNSNKGEWVLDTRLGSSKYGTQIFVPEGKTLDEVSPLTTASVTAEALKITSVNVSSTNQIMTFDWNTNKPANGTVFLTGNNFSESYKSGSGLSTRHIVKFYSLNANSEYSYEIEVVAGDQVVKKRGTFSTNPDIHIFTVQYDNSSGDCSIKENGKLLCNYLLELKYQTGKNSNSLTRPKGVSVNASIPTLNFNKTVVTDDGNYGGDSRIYATFRIPVEKDGTYPVIFSANEATYNYDLVISNINRRKEIICKESGAFCDSKDIAFIDMTPRIIKTLDNVQIEPIKFDGYSSQVIGKFKFTGSPIVQNGNLFLASSAPLQIWFQIQGGNNNRGYGETNLIQSGIIEGTATLYNISLYYGVGEIIITNSQKLNPGTYTLTINSTKDFFARESGNKMVFAGLPITFTFTVKDIPKPEIIPIETIHTYTLPKQGSPVGPGIIGSFKIKFNYNSGVSINSYHIRSEGNYPKIIGQSGYPVDSFVAGSISGGSPDTGSDGVSITPFTFSVSLAGTSAPEQFFNLPAGKLKFYVEDLKVGDQKTNLVRTVSNPLVFEMEIVK